MADKAKLGEAIQLLNTGYLNAKDAMFAGKKADFSLIFQAQALAEEAQQITEYTQCTGCALVLEVGKDNYHRLFLNQHNTCTNKGEVTQALTSQQRELVLCDACAKPITTFLSKEG